MIAFVPGYVFGVVPDYEPDAEFDERDDATVEVLIASLVLVVAVAAWFALAPLGGSGGGSQWSELPAAVCAGVFMAGVETLLIGLLPMRLLPGDIIRRHHPHLWKLLWGASAFLFCLVLLHPDRRCLGSQHPLDPRHRRCVRGLSSRCMGADRPSAAPTSRRSSRSCAAHDPEETMMARCPEPGCHGGIRHFGGGPLHEQQQTACPRCQGTGQVPDGTTTDGGATQRGCLATILGTILGWIYLALLAVVGFVVLSVGGFLFFSADSPIRSGGAELTAAPADPSDSARGFSIGSCLDEPFAGDAIVPAGCGQPHGGEVFAIMRVERTDSEEWPRGGDLHDLGAEACQPLHDKLIAADARMGELFFTTGFSSKEEWQAGDRFIMCLLIAGGDGALLPAGRALPG